MIWERHLRRSRDGVEEFRVISVDDAGFSLDSAPFLVSIVTQNGKRPFLGEQRHSVNEAFMAKEDAIAYAEEQLRSSLAVEWTTV
jgi:hypothetical protein